MNIKMMGHERSGAAGCEGIDWAGAAAVSSGVSEGVSGIGKTARCSPRTENIDRFHQSLTTTANIR